MAWLFACFGYSTKKRKRPKKASKFGSKSRRIQSYQPLLESDVVPQELGISEPVSSSDLELREETKDQKKAKIRKKVRFNLDVITYEPIPNDDASSHSQEDEGDRSWNDSEEEDEQSTGNVCHLVYTPLSQPTNSSSSSHRYSNCFDNEDGYDDVDDNYEDEDEDEECGISDLYDDDDHCDGEIYGWIDPQKIYHEEIPAEHQEFCPLTSSGNHNLGSRSGSTSNTRFRSHYIVSVLNPVENTSQWKAIKSKKVLSHA